MKSLLLLAALASVVGAGLHRHRRHVDTADWLNGEEHSPTFVSMDRDGSKYELFISIATISSDITLN